MVIQKYIKTAGSLVLLSVLGCANPPQKVTELDKPRTSYTEEAEGRAMTNAAARKAKAHNFVEIQFQAKSTLLSDEAKTSLKKMIEDSKQAGKIEEVLVLSWGDQDFPSEGKRKLSKDQRQLANKRNISVENYIKTIRSGNVETHNMAEQANILSKWLNTDDSKLKESLVEAGLPTSADSLKYPSKASHSVIFVKVE